MIGRFLLSVALMSPALASAQDNLVNAAGDDDAAMTVATATDAAVGEAATPSDDATIFDNTGNDEERGSGGGRSGGGRSGGGRSGGGRIGSRIGDRGGINRGGPIGNRGGNGGVFNPGNRGGNGGVFNPGNRGGNGGVFNPGNRGGNGGVFNPSNRGGNGGVFNPGNRGGNGGVGHPGGNHIGRISRDYHRNWHNGDRDYWHRYGGHRGRYGDYGRWGGWWTSGWGPLYPVYDANVYVASVYCGSEWDGVGCPINGAIQGAYITEQYSDAACILNQTWGVNQWGLWVSGGCKGQFEVYYRF